MWRGEDGELDGVCAHLEGAVLHLEPLRTRAVHLAQQRHDPCLLAGAARAVHEHVREVAGGDEALELLAEGLVVVERVEALRPVLVHPEHHRCREVAGGEGARGRGPAVLVGLLLRARKGGVSI